MANNYPILNDLIIIDLTNIDSDNICRLLEDNGLSDHFSADKLIGLKEDGITKLFIDPKGFKVIATIRDDDPLKIFWTNDYLAQMVKAPGISFREVISEEIILDIDIILDKINDRGIASLTLEEKEFLASQK